MLYPQQPRGLALCPETTLTFGLNTNIQTALAFRYRVVGLLRMILNKKHKWSGNSLVKKRHQVRIKKAKKMLLSPVTVSPQLKMLLSPAMVSPRLLRRRCSFVDEEQSPARSESIWSGGKASF